MSREGEQKMQYLVHMKLAAYGRPTSAQEGATLIERYIFPSLEMRKKNAGGKENSGGRADERSHRYRDARRGRITRAR